MNRSLNRRQFIKQTTVAAAGAWLASRPIQARKISPNERLNIAMIGVANRAGDDLKEVSSENIVALCDIDDNYLAAAKETPPAPPNLHYDLWLGPVEYRTYSPEYLPFKWRNWWAFGGGALADFGCHYMDLPHWALGLSYPLTVEPVDGPPVHPESTPPWLIVRYEYPARGEKPAVRLTWYHGGKQPALLSPEQAAK